MSEASRLLVDSSRTAAAVTAGSSSLGPVSEAKRLLDEVSAISLKAPEDKLVGLEGVSLDNYLSHHYDMICQTTLQSAQAMVQQQMHDAQCKYLEAEWDMAKNDFLDTLGHRMPAVQPLLMDQPSNPLNASLTIYQQPGPIGLVEKHADVVRALAVASHSHQNLLSYPTPCRQLMTCLEDDSLSKGDVLGYNTLLDMLSNMVGEDGGVTNRPGYFSPICLDRARVSNLKLANERHDRLTAGALEYYQSTALVLFQGVIGPLGSRSAAGTTQGVLRAYVRHLQVDGIYALIYYYLRAGAYTACIEEVSAFNASAGRDAVDPVVMQMIQGMLPSAAPAASSAGSKASNEAHLQKAYSLEHAKGNADVYKLFVLNLLGNVDKSFYASGYGIPGYNLEDFIWAHLFNMHCSKASSMQHEELLELIYSYGGSAYFDSSGSVYKYVLLLLSCHRFGDAIEYLYVNNKVLIAAHVCVLCLYYGLILPMHALVHNPPLAVVPDSQLVPQAVLKNYLRGLTGAGRVKQMADYLLALHSNFLGYLFNVDAAVKDTMRIKYQHYIHSVLADLIMSLDQEEVLIGRIGATGSRQKGYVDGFLAPQEVSALLSKVAYTYLNEQFDYENAFRFLQLADQHNALLHEMILLLIKQYSSLFHQHGRGQESFLHWQRYCIKFLDQLPQGITEGEQAANNAKLLDILYYLVNLCNAMKLQCIDQQMDQALEVYRGLHVLPASGTSEGVLSVPMVNKVGDEVLLLYTQCLLALHNKYKDRRTNYLQAEERLQLVKEEMRGLYQYVYSSKHFLGSADTLQEVSRQLGPLLQ